MPETAYTPPADGAKIIIVGGGCFGLSTAYALSLRNKYDIWVYDRQQIPTPDAASTDINKIVRMDYGGCADYMHMSVEAFGLWHQWNKERAELNRPPVFHQSGVLLFSQNGSFSEFEKESIRQIQQAGYGHFIEIYDTPEKLVAKFPRFESAVKNGFNVAYLNKEGGWCNSAAAVEHLYEKCKANGVHFVLGEEQGSLENVYCDPKNPSTVVGIKTKDGKTHYADRVLLATGAWCPSIIEMYDQVTATGQQVIQFRPPKNYVDAYSNDPVWCADLSVTGHYGFPSTPGGNLLKVGKHSSGYLNPRESDNVSVPRTQVTHKDDTIPIGALTEFRQFMSRFHPETSSMDIVYSRMCWYADSIDGDFVITPHPDYKNLVIATGDSGHGMKFIPIIGMKIRDVIEGNETYWTKKWAWRNMNTRDTKLDSLRQDSLIQRIILAEENKPEARFATPDEHKASRPKL